MYSLSCFYGSLKKKGRLGRERGKKWRQDLVVNTWESDLVEAEELVEWRHC